MGEDGTYPDSIWTPPADDPTPSLFPEDAPTPPPAGDPAPVAAPTPAPNTPLGGAPPAAEATRRPRRTARIVVAVACFALAAVAAVLVLTNDDQPAERVTGKALSRTPRYPKGTTKVTEVPTTLLVPSTLAPGAEVHCGDWDTAFNFKPLDLDRGVYIWSDFDGWHVRALGQGLGDITGRVSGTVRPNLTNPGDPARVKVTPAVDDLGVDFTIAPGFDAKGFDFSAGCAQKQLRFDLQADGQPIEPTLIHLGSKGGVVAVPFQADRQPG